MKNHRAFLGRPNQLIPRRNERSNAPILPSFLPSFRPPSPSLSLSLSRSLLIVERKEPRPHTRRVDDGRPTMREGVGRIRLSLVGLIQLLYASFRDGCRGTGRLLSSEKGRTHMAKICFFFTMCMHLIYIRK